MKFPWWSLGMNLIKESKEQELNRKRHRSSFKRSRRTKFKSQRVKTNEHIPSGR